MFFELYLISKYQRFLCHFYIIINHNNYNQNIIIDRTEYLTLYLFLIAIYLFFLIFKLNYYKIIIKKTSRKKILI